MFMKPIAVEKPRFRQDPAVMMLDDAEMALELSDLGKSTTVQDPPKASAAVKLSADLLTELYSAASMIMDREECEAMVKEIEQARRPPRVPAAA
jgi:hypothetical protein